MSKRSQGLGALIAALVLAFPVAAGARSGSGDSASTRTSKSKKDDDVSPAFRKYTRSRSHSNAGNPGGKSVHSECGYAGCAKRHGAPLVDDERDK